MGPTTRDGAGWLAQHVDVLFDTDERGRLTRVNEPDPEADPPRVFLARSRTDWLLACRADVPGGVAEHLEAVAGTLSSWAGSQDEDALRPMRDAVRDALGASVSSHGPAFRFGSLSVLPDGRDSVHIDEAKSPLLASNFPYTRSVLEARAPVVGIVRDGAVVSACYAARRRATACEAGVDTVASHRGQGLATAVVAAWAREVVARGMTPLYSTSWDNAASLHVAATLGLEAYADTLSFD